VYKSIYLPTCLPLLNIRVMVGIRVRAAWPAGQLQISHNLDNRSQRLYGDRF